MSAIKSKINQILNDKSLSINKLANLIKNKNSGNLNKMILGQKPFPEYIVKRLLPILEVSREEFDSWMVADKYHKEIIELAVKVKQETKVKRKQLIATVKIDTILEEIDMSRTTLAKQIKYNQSGLNRMIIGKIGFSKPVITKLSTVLDTSENEINAWILADKYSVSTLEMANQLQTQQ